MIKLFIISSVAISFSTDVNSLEQLESYKPFPDEVKDEIDETNNDFFDLSFWGDDERAAIKSTAFEIARLSDSMIWPDGLDPPKSLTDPNSISDSSENESSVWEFLESSWMDDILGDDPDDDDDFKETEEFGGIRGHRRLSWATDLANKNTKVYSSTTPEINARTNKQKKKKKKMKTCTLRASMKTGSSPNKEKAGLVSVKFRRSGGSMAFRYTLSGGDFVGCTGKKCHVAIYSGTSCSDIGNPLYNGENDPWEAVGYKTDSDGTTFGGFYVDSGLGFDCNVGHVVVMRDSSETPIACGKLRVQYECPGTPVCNENIVDGSISGTGGKVRSQGNKKANTTPEKQRTSGLASVKAYNDKGNVPTPGAKRDKMNSAVSKTPRINVDPQTGRYVCPDPESTVVPCPVPDLPALCDKCNGPKNPDGTASASLFACYKECIPSFCCIHDSISERSPSCARTELNCPLYRYCYIVWWKLADTIGPANRFRLDQNDDFFDLGFDTLEEDLINDPNFFDQLFGHYFDDPEVDYPAVYEDPTKWGEDGAADERK